MPDGVSPDLAFAGRRLKQKTLLALTLSSVLPLLVLAYLLRGYIAPTLDPTDTVRFFGLIFLLFFTLLAMIAGGYVIWDVSRTVAGMAELMADQQHFTGFENRGDDVGALIKSFAKVLGTIDQQAGEINSFASRLDAAYRELERTNAKLKEFSFRDEVTGLYNRRFFSIRLDEEISRFRRFNHPVSVVLLDLDGFKAVNDDFGHAVGDDTLRDVAQILMKHSRGINVVSRYGGDEFAILLVETSKAGARLYAERIRQVLSTYAFSHSQRITASLGVASLPDDEVVTSEDLFRAADDALYAAKRRGKNQVAAADSPAKVS